MLLAVLVALASAALAQAPVATRVWTPGAVGVAGDSTRLDAWLMTADETTHLSGQTLAFSVGGTAVGSATTDASGRASVFYINLKTTLP